jgi:hypothetical protein
MVNLRIAWITGLSIDISRRLEGMSFVFKIDDMILNCSSHKVLRKLPPMHYKKNYLKKKGDKFLNAFQYEPSEMCGKNDMEL